MKTLLLFLVVFTFAHAEDSLLWDSSVSGEFNVIRASARPATQGMYLVYACGIDQYMTVHEEELEKLPFALRSCDRAKSDAINTFRNYKVKWHNFDANGSSRDITTALAVLEGLITSGYKGEFVSDVKKFIDQLKKL